MVSFTKPLVTITGHRCHILIRDVVYQSMVEFTNPQVSITDTRKKIKCSKQTLKSPQKNFARSTWYNDLTFYEKKEFPTSQSLQECDDGENKCTGEYKKCENKVCVDKGLIQFITFTEQFFSIC